MTIMTLDTHDTVKCLFLIGLTVFCSFPDKVVNRFPGRVDDFLILLTPDVVFLGLINCFIPVP